MVKKRDKSTAEPEVDLFKDSSSAFDSFDLVKSPTAKLISAVSAVADAFAQQDQMDSQEVMLLLHTYLAKVEKGPVRRGPTSAADKQTVFPDYIICQVCGEKLKTLKRHLRQSHGLTPFAYKEQFGLPVDYPMTAPNYTLTRKNLMSQQMAAGTINAKARPQAPEEEPATRGTRSTRKRER